jgi:hypothetical protein
MSAMSRTSSSYTTQTQRKTSVANKENGVTFLSCKLSYCQNVHEHTLVTSKLDPLQWGMCRISMLVYSSACLPVCLPACLSVSFWLCLPVSLSVFLTIGLSVFLPVCLPVSQCLSFWLFFLYKQTQFWTYILRQTWYKIKSRLEHGLGLCMALRRSNIIFV